MAVVRYDPSYTGLRGFLLSAEARELCAQAAEWGAEYARAIAPVGAPPDDRHPGAYRDSIHVAQTGELGGRNQDRVRVDVVADVPYAAVLEVQAGHGTLGLTADAINEAEGGARAAARRVAGR
jgi:hypothetical protein